MSNEWQNTLKGVLLGGTGGAATGAAVGSFYGRVVLFSGAVLAGVGAPAVLGLAVVGGIAGAVGGGIVGHFLSKD